MVKTIKYLFVLAWFSACGQSAPTTPGTSSSAPPKFSDKDSIEVIDSLLRLGAERTEIYLPILKDRTVGLVANQTSMVGESHLVDTLLKLGVDVKRVFAPEHGFRGNVSAGKKVKDSRDPLTGLPIISLYGKNYRPSAENLQGLDVVIFDIQDVGVRFYTYISTMSYMMETCAEHGIPVLVLDRPNPNGHYVDGPVLKKGFSSFVGLHEVPVVHGMTVGEYAKMVNGEGWLRDNAKCDLTVVEMENYSRKEPYELPIPPSPNLPNQKAVYLYPSLCFFEGTVVSEGRGTDRPFQQFGYPNMPNGNTAFTPMSIFGVAAAPKFEDEECSGTDLSSLSTDSLRNLSKLKLTWLVRTYTDHPKKEDFFKPKFFDMLAGSSDLRQQIVAGKTADEIRNTWKTDLVQFRIKRKKYLLYP